ncbi:MAG TPA: C4-type zinc ribbon domain-containing protein [Candidatus Omnitrophota bacterium]|nr:C4-type zinc ribbon domain-containing protein [Candidatus Omnitrophota bacterium]
MTETTKIQQDIEILKQVQVLDKEIYDLTQELLSIPGKISACELLCEEAKKQVKDLEKQHKDFQLKQKEKELELSEKEEQIRKFQGQLTQVKTNKEYSAIQHEIASVKADNSLLEETILVLMDDVEKSARGLAQGRENEKQEEKKLQDQKAEFKKTEESFRKKIDELQAQKKELMNQVAPETAVLYEKILAKKSGVALVPIEGENCSSCHMTLRAQVVNEVRLLEAIVVCENCSRILYEQK